MVRWVDISTGVIPIPHQWERRPKKKKPPARERNVIKKANLLNSNVSLLQIESLQDPEEVYV